jgi:hypothetical protein
MDYTERVLLASGKGQKDGLRCIKIIEKGEERTVQETDELFGYLEHLSWNREVTHEQHSYVSGFRCGVYLAGWEAPKSFAGVFKGNEHDPEFLSSFTRIDTTGMFETFRDMVNWAKGEGAWGVCMSNVCTGAFERISGNGRRTNQICIIGWHFKLQRWYHNNWMWAGGGVPEEDPQLIPIDKSAEWYHEYSNHPECEAR